MNNTHNKKHLIFILLFSCFFSFIRAAFNQPPTVEMVAQAYNALPQSKMHAGPSFTYLHQTLQSLYPNKKPHEIELVTKGCMKLLTIAHEIATAKSQYEYNTKLSHFNNELRTLEKYNGTNFYQIFYPTQPAPQRSTPTIGEKAAYYNQLDLNQLKNERTRLQNSIQYAQQYNNLIQAKALEVELRHVNDLITAKLPKPAYMPEIPGIKIRLSLSPEKKAELGRLTIQQLDKEAGRLSNALYQAKNNYKANPTQLNQGSVHHLQLEYEYVLELLNKYEEPKSEPKPEPKKRPYSEFLKEMQEEEEKEKAARVRPDYLNLPENFSPENKFAAAWLLDVDVNASLDVLKKRFRELTLRYHPDRNMEKSPEERRKAEHAFKMISQAYALLTKGADLVSNERQAYFDALSSRIKLEEELIKVSNELSKLREQYRSKPTEELKYKIDILEAEEDYLYKLQIKKKF